MNNKKNFFIYLSLILPLFSFSCSKKIEASLNDYKITRSITILNQDIGQTTPIINASTATNLEIRPTWSYSDGNILLFKDNCLFSKKEIELFANTYNLSCKFADEKYNPVSTSYFTYNKIEKYNGAKINLNNYQNNVSVDWKNDLLQYSVTKISTQQNFNIYVTVDLVSSLEVVTHS